MSCIVSSRPSLVAGLIVDANTMLPVFQLEGVQLHGGAGYMDEYPISRQLTDAMIAPIYAGSSEVMKIIVSRDFLGDDYQPFNTRNF